MSFAASSSWPAETVTVCAEFQLVVVNVSVDEGTVTSVLFERMTTVTVPVGNVVQYSRCTCRCRPRRPSAT